MEFLWTAITITIGISLALVLLLLVIWMTISIIGLIRDEIKDFKKR